jgi:hypothetical protein
VPGLPKVVEADALRPALFKRMSFVGSRSLANRLRSFDQFWFQTAYWYL